MNSCDHVTRLEIISIQNKLLKPACIISEDYILVDRPGVTCHPIAMAEECEAAAQQLGLSDTTAIEDGNSPGYSADPPNCYFEAGALKFNSFGANTGSCGYYGDKCLCRGR